MKPGQNSLYVKEGNLYLFEQAERLGGGSLTAGIVKVLQSQFGERPQSDQYEVIVTWDWSQAHRQAQIVAGKRARCGGDVTLSGAVPLEFFSLIQDDTQLPLHRMGDVEICLHNSRATIRCSCPGQSRYNEEDAPDTWGKLLVVLSQAREQYNDEMAKQKAEEERQKAEREGVDTMLRHFVETDGNAHVERLMTAGYNWEELAWEQWCKMMADAAPLAEAKEKAAKEKDDEVDEDEVDEDEISWGKEPCPPLKAIEAKEELQAWLSKELEGLPVTCEVDVMCLTSEGGNAWCELCLWLVVPGKKSVDCWFEIG